ncbi:MAG: hypothetical protein PHS97_07885 [Oscillospiraceae bacterium]|nr:hypothetical protein [Oscillospiraceae bacterium]
MRIETYGRPRKVSGGIAFRAALCVLLCAATFCCKQYNVEGTQTVRQVVFGVQDSTAAAAFSAFSAAMTEGEPAIEAFSELCGAVFTKA